MMQAYELEKSGGGVWMHWARQKLDIIQAFPAGMEANDLRGEEILRTRSTHASRWS